MKNLKFTFGIIFWIITFLISLLMILMAVKIISSNSDSFLEMLYNSRDLDRGFLLIGLTSFFLSISGIVLLMFMNQSYDKDGNLKKKNDSNSVWLNGIKIMWSSFIILGLVMIVLSFLLNGIINIGTELGGLFWYLFFQGMVLVIIGAILCPIFNLLKKVKCVESTEFVKQ